MDHQVQQHRMSEPLLYAAKLARMARPDPSTVVLTRHARFRFTERIDDEADVFTGLGALVRAALESHSLLVLSEGRPPCRQARVGDTMVIFTVDFQAVKTVYRLDGTPARKRWQVPVGVRQAVA